MLKPGSCRVESILSIRSLFLPTVSWGPVDGKHNCGRLLCEEGYAGLFRLGFLFEHVPFLNSASTGKTQ